MPLRIAFDLDGVLADMESALISRAASLFDGPTARRMLERPVEVRAFPVKQPVDDAAAPTHHGRTGPTPRITADEALPLLKVNMTARQQSRLWRHIGNVENFWETLDECEPGVVERLAMLVAERRWEIVFLTKRPETVGRTAQAQTQRWLVSKGFPLPSVFVVQRSRGRIAAALELDIVIDDRPENCLDVVVDSKARAILVWRPDMKALPPSTKRLGIGVVSSVSQCLDILTDLDRSADQPGVVDRVMRLLGLKEPLTA